MPAIRPAAIKPTNNEWQIIHISVEGVKFESADELIGMGVYETAPRLLEKYGKIVDYFRNRPSFEFETDCFSLRRFRPVPDG
jgi:hypothetical protein